MTKRQPKPTRALVPAGKLARTTGRRSLGRARSDETLFPVAPPVAELPSGYATTLRDLKQRIEQTRLSTIITANTAMIRLYWHIRDVIRSPQERAGWGAKVIDRLSHDLRQAFRTWAVCRRETSSTCARSPARGRSAQSRKRRLRN